MRRTTTTSTTITITITTTITTTTTTTATIPCQAVLEDGNYISLAYFCEYLHFWYLQLLVKKTNTEP